MVTTLARIIKYGVQNFLRNGWLSAATIAVMILALFVFQGLIIFRFLTNAAVSSIQDKIDISAYFKSNTAEDDILKLEKTIEGLAEVKSVEYISQDRALEIFKAKHSNDEVITTALKELETNPLLASLNIKANHPDDYSKIADYIKQSSLDSLIEKITYAQNQLAINRMARIMEALDNLGFGIVIVLSLIASLVTFNTVRLAIYSNREELGIMRLVGASNKFINGPYMFNGIIYGVVAAVLSFILVTPIISLVSPYLQAFVPEIDLTGYFYGNFSKLLGYQIIFGIALGTVSAYIAVRRYLKI